MTNNLNLRPGDIIIPTSRWFDDVVLRPGEEITVTKMEEDRVFYEPPVGTMSSGKSGYRKNFLDEFSIKYTPKVGDYFVPINSEDIEDPIIILSEKDEAGLFSISVGPYKELSHEDFFVSQYRRRLSASEVASLTREKEPIVNQDVPELKIGDIVIATDWWSTVHIPGQRFVVTAVEATIFRYRLEDDASARIEFCGTGNFSQFFTLVKDEPVEKSLEDKQKEFDELLEQFEPAYRGPYDVTRSVYQGDRLNELTFTFDSKEQAWLYFEGLVHLHQAQELEGDDWLEIYLWDAELNGLAHFYRG